MMQVKDIVTACLGWNCRTSGMTDRMNSDSRAESRLLSRPLCVNPPTGLHGEAARGQRSVLKRLLRIVFTQRSYLPPVMLCCIIAMTAVFLLLQCSAGQFTHLSSLFAYIVASLLTAPYGMHKAHQSHFTRSG